MKKLKTLLANIVDFFFDYVGEIFTALFVFLIIFMIFMLAKAYSAGSERAEQIGNEKILLIQRAENGSIIRCHETYNKYVRQNETTYTIEDRVRIPVSNTEMYAVEPYTEGYHENGLDACFRNLITH